MPPKAQLAPTPQRLIKALSHPFRARALTILSERPASASELARELGETLSNANYHFEKLKEWECIREVDSEQRRGATERFYAVSRALLWSDYWAECPLPARESFSGSIIRNSFADATRSFETGKFEGRPDRHLSRHPMLVDEEGWKALNKLLDEGLEAALRIQEECNDRAESEGLERFHAVAVQMSFEMPEEPSRSALG